MDTRGRSRVSVRSKVIAYFEANCSWEVQRSGNLKIGQLGDVADSIERINDAMTKRRAQLDSGRRLGLFTM